jgi:hypothetical protein
MRTVIRLGGFTIVIATVLVAWWLHSSSTAADGTIGPGVVVSGGTPNQFDMGRWAVERFANAGLEPPAVEIEFHGDPSGCGGHFGLARDGHVDVCTTLVNVMARRALLHEMSHIWLDQNLDVDVRKRFMEMRELPSWNASGDPWELRGYEQGAEIIAWALGERILTPQVPDIEPTLLARGFELLTGSAPPAYTNPGTEQGQSTHKGVVRTWRNAPDR